MPGDGGARFAIDRATGEGVILSLATGFLDTEAQAGGLELGLCDAELELELVHRHVIESLVAVPEVMI